ncbi:hypothetical protein B0J12DRAFT_739197 [Macrophomina phaseolina]|uniref:Uncharacterized protein n=1 Tax=Macrophomina phaseolina TaxID=35725 RepID=A0ABQ8GDL9_9PEZI|nr:hypothetical protein B0J12DRAFT_739197 [Macrophomina phaseolina]
MSSSSRENACTIHEGPVDYAVNQVTGAKRESQFLEHHSIAPISPKLSLILQSQLLPCRTEAAHLELSKRKRAWRELFQLVLQTQSVLASRQSADVANFRTP